MKVTVIWSSPNKDGLTASAVYWSEMTECFKAFVDRLRRQAGKRL